MNRAATLGLLAPICFALGVPMAQAQTVTQSITALTPWAGQTIESVTWTGNKVTKDYIIDREIESVVGQPLDLVTVREDLTRLENLSIFGRTSVEGHAEGDGVALVYEVGELPWLIPYPALSFTDQNGFSIGLGISSPNLTGRARKASAKVLAGGTTTFNLSYNDPWVAGDHLSVGAKTWLQTRENVVLDFQEKTFLLRAAIGTYIGEYGRGEFAAAWYVVNSDKDSITISPDNTDDLLALTLGLGVDSRDSWLNPRRGWNLKSQVGYFGGDANSFNLTIPFAQYNRLGTRHTIAQGPLLALQSGDVGTELPSYLQYFMGGSNSIRGYRVDELGKVLFGADQLLYNLEYRYLLKPLTPFGVFKWSVSIGFELAAFFDWGIAWTHGNEFSLDRSKMGYGVGFRVLAPGVNSIRFDMGVSEFGDVVFNFAVNTIFIARLSRVR